MTSNIEVQDGIALLGALGALAAVATTLNGGEQSSQRPIITIPEGFGDRADTTDSDEVAPPSTEAPDGTYEYEDPNSGGLQEDEFDFGGTDSTSDGWDYQEPSDNPATDSGGVYDGGMW